MKFPKVVVWWIFAVGMVATVIGVADLAVPVVVSGLIVASTSGLTLLHFRAENLGRLDDSRGPAHF